MDAEDRAVPSRKSGDHDIGPRLATDLRTRLPALAKGQEIASLAHKDRDIEAALAAAKVAMRKAARVR